MKPTGPSQPTIEEGLAALRRRWPELFVEDEEDSPIFVLSAGWRSGSTLLQRLLVEHCLVWGEPYGHAWSIPSLADPLRCFTDGWPESHHFHVGQPTEQLAATFIANLYPGVRDFKEAHRAFFRRLFAEPARASGHERWGVKEVRLDADHAHYLRWLYPRARFLFLLRNPYDAWRSYAARAAAGWRWYNRWPDQPLTAAGFATHWNRLTTGFLEQHRRLGGLLIRYEELATGAVAEIAKYVGFRLSRDAARTNPRDGGPPPLDIIPDDDAQALTDGLGPLAASLGYHPGPERQSGGHTALKDPARQARDRCVIIVPYTRFVEPSCEAGLRQLENRGFVVRRMQTADHPSESLSQAATRAVREGFEEIMWIGHDMEFPPDAVDLLRAHGLPLASGVYPRRTPGGVEWNVSGALSASRSPGSNGLLEIDAVDGGFLLTRREVYLTIQHQEGLACCRGRGANPFVPFFLPMVIRGPDGDRYLEGWSAFCARSSRRGFVIRADPRVRPRPIVADGVGWSELIR